MTQYELLYREGRLKQWVRRHFASKDSRAGTPLKASTRERRVMSACYVMAVASLAGVVILTEAGSALWLQLLPMASLLLWCGLAALVDTASTWQRQYCALLIERACRD